MSPRGVQPTPGAVVGAPSTTEPAGKGGGSGFAAMLHQLGVGAHAAGDDGSAAKAALGDGRAAAPPTAAGQILPGQLTSGLAEISACLSWSCEPDNVTGTTCVLPSRSLRNWTFRPISNSGARLMVRLTI